MASTITDSQGNEYPIYKFGGRWICEGPNGRFQAWTKAEAKRLLNETGGRYDETTQSKAR